MAYSADVPRRVVIRANRETLALIGGACTVTLLIAYGVHGRAAAPPPETAIVATAQPQQDWTGHLAEVAPNAPATVPAAEPLSSESLTVPKAQLALPPMPSKPKGRPCEAGASPCPAKVAVAPASAVSTRVPTAPAKAIVHAKADKDQGLMSKLNPLNHLPDFQTIKRPFAYAGETVSGWFKRF